MPNEELVQSSDGEEVEALAAQYPEYWTSASFEITTRRRSLRDEVSSRAVDPVASSSSQADASTRASNQNLWAYAEGRPFKRVKLSPSPVDEPALSISDPMPMPPSTRSSPMRSLSPQLGELLHAPEVPRYETHAEGRVGGARHGPLVGSADERNDIEGSLFIPNSPLNPPDKSDAPIRSPLSLFSPPRGPFSVSMSPLLRDNSGAQLSKIVPNLTQESRLTSSPLTPIPSPSKSTQAIHIASALVTHPHSPIDPQSPPLSPSFQAGHTRDQLMEHSRYSLRARQAKQVNPYAYDKLLYKRQMRANPEAIVKIVSPPRARRRHGSPRHRHDGQSSDAEDEYDTLGEGDDDDERRHRKRITLEEARVTEIGDAGLPETTAAVASGSSVTAQNHARWYPKAFDDHFSSSEDELSIENLNRTEQSSQSAILRPRLRPKPFPMRRRRPKSISPEEHVDDPAQKDQFVSPPRLSPRMSPEHIHSEIEDESIQWRQKGTPRSSECQTSRSSSRNLDSIYAPLSNSSESALPVPSSPTDFGVSMSVVDSDVEGVVTDDLDQNMEAISVSDSGSGGGGQGSESSSSSASMHSKDRRRLKVLKRMMPGVLIARHLKQATTGRAQERHHADGDEEQSLLPGQSKVRIRMQPPREGLEIRGDSESSDIEVAGAASPDSSDSGISILPYRLSRPGQNITNVIVISDSGTDAEAGSDDDINEEMGRWFSGRTAHRATSERAEAREGDLIDRMLSRTRVSRSGHTKGGHRRNRGIRNTSHLKARLRVVTSGAKRYGAGQQTLLPFTRISPEQDERRSEAQDSDENNFQIDNHLSSKLPSKKRKHTKPLDGNVYTFSSGGAHLVSGRSHVQPITVDAEASTGGGMSRSLHSHTTSHSHPAPRQRSRRDHLTSVPTYETSLHDFWDEVGDDVQEIHQCMPKSCINDQEFDLGRRVTVDFDIPFLPSGMVFPADTYLGHGWLHELLSLTTHEQEIIRPHSCAILGHDLHPSIPIQDFMTFLINIFDDVRDAVFLRSRDGNVEVCRQWEIRFHSICQYLSWMFSHAGEDDATLLIDAVKDHVVRLHALLDETTELVSDDDSSNHLALEVQWFVVEALFRIQRFCSHDHVDIIRPIKALMRRLLDFNPQDSVLLSFVTQNSLNEGSHPRRMAELWICLIHLTNSLNPHASLAPSSSTTISFWNVYTEATAADHQDLHPLPSFDLEASETAWRDIFCLCALSQFSAHGITTSTPRLSASWRVVTAALERVRLTADPVADAGLKKRGLHKRDGYIRFLVSRCLVLAHKWRWHLDDSSAAFNRLLDIFKSRRFANLSDEPSDFPSFLRYNNLQLLFQNKRSDTAFTFFLKLVVQAAKDFSADAGQTSGVSPKIKKLLSLCVPVGSVPFTKATPPTAHELSMLYNRFSAVAVSIYLEPTLSTLKYRLVNARRYVNFKDTDNETRRACIRGLMHLSILLQHLQLPLDDILDWLAEMSNILIDEFCEFGQPKDNVPRLRDHSSWIVLSIQMLLRSVRHIIETPFMEPGQTVAPYPDPALLKGPWVTRVFSNTTTLPSMATTGMEIRRLVQAFLDARAKVVPRPARPRPPVVEETEESQEDYGHFDLDLNDPELLAALGGNEDSSSATANKEKEKIVCEIVNTDILPAVYRLVCKRFIDLPSHELERQSYHEADKWIDCWVGCASVVVQNGRRDWSFFLSLGPQSWERIIDPIWRRRVGLRFMYMVLQLDPSAYPAYTDRFTDVLFECLVPSRVTLEHDYVSLLFSIDGLRHPLLHDIPCELPDNSIDHKLSAEDFSEKRLDILEKMIDNLASGLGREMSGDTTLIASNQRHIGSMVCMLSTMQDTFQRFNHVTEEKLVYSSFCQQVFQVISRYPMLYSNSRLSTLIISLRNVL